MFTLTVILDHHNRVKKGGLAPLEIRITHKRRVNYINTGIHVTRAQWICGSIVNRPDAEELNERLAILVKKTNRELNLILDGERSFDFAELRERVFSGAKTKSKKRDFIEWCYKQIPMLNITDGTRKHYNSTMKQLEKFDTIRNWDDLTSENIMYLDSCFRTIRTANRNGSNGEPTNISDAGVYNHHKCLKALINRAVAMGVAENNPYDRLKGKFRRGDKENVEYLTEDEMKKIETMEIQRYTMLDDARDLFVFQMYTGMAYSDAMSFSIQDYKLINGKWTSIGARVKTGVSFVSQLLPPVVRVLEKHGMKLPKIDNSDYNYCLKTIGSMAGISTRMHSHLARHTFATFMLRNGVKIENLAKMLGHSNITQTQRYAKVLAKSVYEEFDNIAGKL